MELWLVALATVMDHCCSSGVQVFNTGPSFKEKKSNVRAPAMKSRKGGGREGCGMLSPPLFVGGSPTAAAAARSSSAEAAEADRVVGRSKLPLYADAALTTMLVCSCSACRGGLKRAAGPPLPLVVAVEDSVSHLAVVQTAAEN